MKSIFSLVGLTFVCLLTVFHTAVFGQAIGSRGPTLAFCIGSSETIVFASDVMALSSEGALGDISEAWRSYLKRSYQASGSCYTAKGRSKQEAYTQLDAAVWAAERAVNAQGQLQNRQALHTGWRGGA